MLDTRQARKLAAHLLGRDSSRYAHTAAVAARAEQLRDQLRPDEGHAVVAAAWLHDIGYAESLRVTGFHPIDGAIHLRQLGEEALARFVAHHSCAHVEADLRGLLQKLEQFPRPPARLLDSLTYCDMTSGPTGRRVSLEERLAEIADRYGPGHVVTLHIAAARAELEAAVHRVAHPT